MYEFMRWRAEILKRNHTQLNQNGFHAQKSFLVNMRQKTAEVWFFERLVCRYGVAWL